ncbi:MAG: recombination mediator RecR [Deltaproteobacteria bacterium]|nr:recombination mediator RecR [Deltaproteobacteria bacterium]MDE0213945.1 recombination mediator RecR [Deltaproteobacteria bacterium]
MNGYPAPLARVIEQLSKLPGIGEKTAGRLAFHLLKERKEAVLALSGSMEKLKQEMGLCPQCFGLSEIPPGREEVVPCKVCRDPARDTSTICVVEEPSDLMAVERSAEYKGLYHVLHGAIFPLNGVGPDALKIKELMTRLRANPPAEVIAATNATRAGDATALYLAKMIKPLGIRITRIARGLPMGGEIEYTDAGTLGEALDGRRDL